MTSTEVAGFTKESVTLADLINGNIAAKSTDSGK